MPDTSMPYDATEAKRYVLRELMEMMDKDERNKLKSSFKPDSEPWETERATTETDMHSDLAGKMLPGKVEQPSASDDHSDIDDEPVSDSVNEYSRKRYKK